MAKKPPVYVVTEVSGAVDGSLPSEGADARVLPTQPGSRPVSGADDPAWVRGIDRVLSVQRPLVLAHIRSIRKRHPHATGDQMVRILERRYLTAVTSGGAAVGATAMVPAIGTGITIALSGLETAGFLETTALFAQSVAEVHGIAVTDPLRARALVMTLMLGNTGSDLVKNFTGDVLGQGNSRRAHWGRTIASSMPQMVMGPFADQVRSRFMKHLVTTQGTTLVGKAVPFGIGAAIGGVGNHVAGRGVVTSARTAFGPAPIRLPRELEPIERTRQGTVQEAAAGAVGATVGATLELGGRVRSGLRELGSKIPLPKKRPRLGAPEAPGPRDAPEEPKPDSLA
ncbi:hypothetical protein D9V32_06400 [Mycetocola tolaasinivorans]|uniref:Di-and tripeptidase n=1 Tax=Mycetocola tolaasinivorans TaxID=76635 RepID=A0A3L7AAW3_9MICO|nr:hypothetical protein [Mycetocola tolaasinivorans]RLP76482.1 hypothetical protein D9V32_06400 [Mycetocola tolaasinivorans]